MFVKHLAPINSLPPKIFFEFLPSADFFQNQLFSKKYFRNTIGVLNSLDPDQAGHFVGPDLVSNCLQNYQQTTLGELTCLLRTLGRYSLFRQDPWIW